MHGTSVWSRFFAGALTIWFGLVMAAPVVLHSCPQALASRGSAAPMAMPDHHGSHHSSMPSDRAPKDCTCLGLCRGPAPAVLPQAAVGPIAVILPVPAGPAAVAMPVLPGALPEHSQPFATAPPLPQA
jgi:hypothetical protein